MTVTLTVDSVFALRPCSDYTRGALEAYARGRKRVRLTTVLRDESLPLADRIWLGCTLLPEIRWWCADRAVRVHAVAALRSAGLYAEAGMLAALPEITDAATATAAANAAAAAAAAYAAHAAHAAARDAARDAARAAAHAAAGYAAAGYAARNAERRAQLDRLIAMAGGAT
jgi:hypothetical protein